MSKDTGGPAFSVAGLEYRDNGGAQYVIKPQPGKTLRDSLAEKAMVSMVEGVKWDDLGRNAERVARVAYQLADAMLAERAK